MTLPRRPQPESTPRSTNRPPDHTGLLIGALILFLVGWLGLFQLITSTLPRIGGELWLFFLLLQLAVMGTVIPFVRFLNLRFTPIDREVPPSSIILRQSVWIGLFVVTCAWLQIPRALSLPVAFFLAVVFIMLEFFLRSRERLDEA